MRKFIITLILTFVVLAGFTQIRTINDDYVLKPDVTSPRSVTLSYTGVAADTLTSNQDTLLYNITINKAVPMNYYIKIGLDTIAGADTTCTVNINGRMFDDESWTLIETTTTSAVGGEVNTVIESMTDADYTASLVTASYIALTDTTGLLGYPADSIVIPQTTGALTLTPSIKPCYRQLQVEIIINGDDSVGTGIKLEDIEWYFQEAK